jgi:hypothetical protein
MDNPYIRLTQEFNHGRLRAILASGQAVVLYRLAIMSKDGDWILREETEALTHVIATLARHGARAEWTRVSKEIAGLPLTEAHEIMATRAAEHLPREP